MSTPSTATIPRSDLPGPGGVNPAPTLRDRPAGGRTLTLHLREPLARDEGVVLCFEDGERVPLYDDGECCLRRTLEEAHLGRPFQLLRTPDEVPEASLSGQPVPPRCLARLEEPALLYPAAWIDRLPEVRVRGGALTRDYEVEGSWLPEARRVRVLSPGGSDGAGGLPLVFALDGQFLLAGEEPPGGVPWSLDLLVEEMASAGRLPPFLLVAVDHGGPRRTYEYTFCDDPASDRRGGGASEFLGFLLDEVEPMIRRRFPVARRPPALLGAGTGGLLALWAALRHPSRVSAVAAMSPRVGWGDEGILRLVGAEGPRPRVWVDKGDSEDLTATWQLRALTAKLESLGWREGSDLRSLLVAGGRSGAAAWSDRSAAALGWMLAGERAERLD